MTKKQWLIIAAVVIIGGGVTGGLIYKNKNSDSMAGMNHSSMSMNGAASSTNFAVNLMSGKTYSSSQPTMLHFDVEQNGKVYKDFQVDSTKLMHLIVVRKDRSNFQHVHPEYDSKTGMFMMSGFTFPTDGEYRVYANFEAKGAKKDAMGMVETEAPYVDVKVGDTSKYTPTPLGADSLTDTQNGITAAIIMVPGDDSPSVGVQTPTFYAGQDDTVTVGLNRGTTPVTNLQAYLGNLGHMVILGPNLEFIHAHPMTSDLNNQTGYIPFMVTFPTAGQYKIYLQTQASDQVSTFNYNLTVKDMPKSSSSSSSDNSMQGMSH